MKFAGSLANLNAALNGLKFIPEPGYTGNAALQIQASDGTKSDTDSVALTIKPKPVTTNHAPTLDAANFTIEPHSPKGTLAGQMQGKDADGDALTYSLIANNPDADFDDQPAFAIDPKTGKITVNDSDELDPTLQSVFRLGVQASDGSLTAKAAATITLDGGTGGNGGTPGVTVTAQQTPAVTTENNGLVTNQPGGEATFSVVLASQPSADVVITFTSEDETEGKPVNSVLTFTHDNWNKPQTLVVRGVDDLLYDGNVSYTVSGKVASDDINYTRGIIVDNLILTNRDDLEDKPKVVFGDKNPDNFRDELRGGNGPDKLYGNEDIDYLYGGLGDDSLDGGNDDDKLYGEDGNDTLKGQEGLDLLEGGNGADKLYGGLDSDTLNGGTGDDKLYGEQDDDVLNGGDGNDTLDGGLGADQMNGGKGADIYYVDEPGDKVNDQGGDGAIDTVLIPVFLSYTLGATIENGTLTGADNSNLTGNSLANLLAGNSGNNVLDGSTGNDVLKGGGGNDTLKGGTGIDTADYSAATVKISASLTTGKASGQGADTLSAIENLLGGAGSDTLSGDSGANSLAGGGGADLLKGGEGSDKLTGGGGKDSLTGGAGADRYVYTSGNQTGLGSTARDVVADFSKTDGDKLDVSAWDAKPSVTGVQHWSFVASFSGAAGQIRFDAGAHLALFDQNGDKQADFQIELTGVASLSASDFALA
jgi:Ca2+-binding RTX toxin-like protein